MRQYNAVLSDLMFLQRGFDITKKEQREGPYPVVSSSGIKSYHSAYKVTAPGVVIGRKGTLGTVHYVSEDFWPHDTTLWVKDFKENEPRFCYYFLKTLNLERFDSGGANPTLNRNHVHSLEIHKPDIDIQRSIASILSNYDDLIDNNNRRIALLEESVHRLYREWFVHLRFSGHERVTVRDGVPEGWEKEPLDQALFLQRGFDLPKRKRRFGTVPIYASTGINGFHNVAKVKGPGVVTGRSGTLGTVMYVHGDFWPLNTSLWVKEFRRVTATIAYFLLSNMDLSSYRGGAAVPTLNRNAVHAVEILLPPEALQAQFDAVAVPVLEQIQLLTQYNQQLRKTRDRLLPRLMNGTLTP